MPGRGMDFSWLRLFVLPALAIVGALAAAIWFLDLVPPKRMTLAAGRPGGAYHALAEQYRGILARDGIDLRIVETAGSVENAEDLVRAENPVDAAFLQGGIELPPEAPVEALASTFLEPLWIFHSGALADPANPTGWQNLRIAAGEPGGGTRFVVDTVMRALSIDASTLELLPTSGQAAADALLAGDVDVALFVAPVTAPYLQPLFASDTVETGTIRDRQALVRRLPFVQLAEIPRSGFDYAGRKPPREIELIAMVGRLVAQSDLHPSLVDRLVNAAREVHSRRDLITDQNQFPSTRSTDMTVNPQAATMLASPPSPLYRYLPYWVVAQINSFALLLVPVLFLLIPIFRIVPGIYQWQMRSRVYRRYLDLRDIDHQAMRETDPAALAELARHLDDIEHDLVGLRLPLRFREYAYTMRMHLDLVRRKIAERLAAR